MHALADKWHSDGLRIAFVPTMGALHDGHLSLLEDAKKHGDKIVLSIYVNPKQFAPTEDLAKYPRDKDGDLAKAKDMGVDAVFFPSDETMYPEDFQTYVETTEVTKGLCGASRPSHFRGVTTVVLKLINIVQPQSILLGEKDYQQLVTIRTMAKDLNLPVEVVGVATVREKDGLAMSSRNAYLSPSERESALSISRSLSTAKRAVGGGETSSAKIISLVKGCLAPSGLRMDYVKICNANTLKDTQTITPPARLLIAAFAGKTRLIDNCAL